MIFLQSCQVGQIRLDCPVFICYIGNNINKSKRKFSSLNLILGFWAKYICQMAVLNLSGIQEQQLMFKQSSVDGTEVPGSEEEALS